METLILSAILPQAGHMALFGAVMMLTLLQSLQNTCPELENIRRVKRKERLTNRSLMT